MVQIYSPDNTDYDVNGDAVLDPISCEVEINMNGSWELTLEVTIDDADAWIAPPGSTETKPSAAGKFHTIEHDAVICVDTPVGDHQLFRIYQTQRTNDTVIAYARPIFMDSANDVFLVDSRPTDMTAQQALNYIMQGTKYSGESDLITVNTAYYIRKNLIEAIAGSDDNSILNRWGGEISYNNYKVSVMNQLGSDNGLRVEFGRNIESIQETIDMSDVCTRAVPQAFNGYTLDGDEPWVDSPLINAYPIVYTKVLEFSDMKLRDDVSEEEEEDDDSEIYDTLAELQAAMIARIRQLYLEGMDLPNITYDIDMVDLRRTDEYAKYADLETVNLGDTVHCYHRRLGIETEARVVKYLYDCVRNAITEITIGDIQEDYLDRINDIVSSSGGTVDLSRLQAQYDYIIANYVRTDTLDARLGYFENIVTETISALYASINTIEAALIDVNTLLADKATIEDLQAVYATIDDLSAIYASIGDLEAVAAQIGDLSAITAQVVTLLGGDITAGDITSIILTADTTVIETAVIANAVAGTVVAALLTADYIDTNLIHIGSEDGTLMIDDSTILICDADGNPRIQIGLDGTGDYNLALWDADGNNMWNAGGVTEYGINDGVIRNDMVADDAAIQGSKLDIASVAECLNADGSLILQASQVYIGDEGLSIVLAEMQAQIDSIDPSQWELYGIYDAVDWFCLWYSGTDAPDVPTTYDDCLDVDPDEEFSDTRLTFYLTETGRERVPGSTVTISFEYKGTGNIAVRHTLTTGGSSVAQGVIVDTGDDWVTFRWTFDVSTLGGDNFVSLQTAAGAVSYRSIRLSATPVVNENLIGEVEEVNEVTYRFRLSEYGLSVVAGQTVTFSFEYRSESSFRITSLDDMLDNSEWASGLLTYDASDDWALVSITFTVGDTLSDDPNLYLSFRGSQPDEIRNWKLELGDHATTGAYWTTERLTAGEGEYLWTVTEYLQYSGSSIWGTPICLTDGYLRMTTTTLLQEFEVMDGHVQSLIGQVTNIEGDVSGIQSDFNLFYQDYETTINQITSDVVLATENASYAKEQADTLTITVEGLSNYVTESMEILVPGYEYLESSVSWLVQNTNEISQGLVYVEALIDGLESEGLLDFQAYYCLSDDPENPPDTKPYDDRAYAAIFCLGTSILGRTESTSAWTTEKLTGAEGLNLLNFYEGTNIRSVSIVGSAELRLNAYGKRYAGNKTVVFSCGIKGSGTITVYNYLDGSGTKESFNINVDGTMTLVYELGALSDDPYILIECDDFTFSDMKLELGDTPTAFNTGDSLRYVWMCWRKIYVDGTVTWTDPELLTDAYTNVQWSYIHEELGSVTIQVGDLSEAVSTIEVKVDNIKLSVTATDDGANAIIDIGTDDWAYVLPQGVRNAFADNAESHVYIGAGIVEFEAGTFLVSSRTFNITEDAVITSDNYTYTAGTIFTTMEAGKLTFSYRNSYLGVDTADLYMWPDSEYGICLAIRSDRTYIWSKTGSAKVVVETDTVHISGSSSDPASVPALRIMGSVYQYQGSVIVGNGGNADDYTFTMYWGGRIYNDFRLVDGNLQLQYHNSNPLGVYGQPDQGASYVRLIGCQADGITAVGNIYYNTYIYSAGQIAFGNSLWINSDNGLYVGSGSARQAVHVSSAGAVTFGNGSDTTWIYSGGRVVIGNSVHINDNDGLYMGEHTMHVMYTSTSDSGAYQLGIGSNSNSPELYLWGNPIYASSPVHISDNNGLYIGSHDMHVLYTSTSTSGAYQLGIGSNSNSPELYLWGNPIYASSPVYISDNNGLYVGSGSARWAVHISSGGNLVFGNGDDTTWIYSGGEVAVSNNLRVNGGTVYASYFSGTANYAYNADYAASAGSASTADSAGYAASAGAVSKSVTFSGDKSSTTVDFSGSWSSTTVNLNNLIEVSGATEAMCLTNGYMYVYLGESGIIHIGSSTDTNSVGIYTTNGATIRMSDYRISFGRESFDHESHKFPESISGVSMYTETSDLILHASGSSNNIEIYAGRGVIVSSDEWYYGGGGFWVMCEMLVDGTIYNDSDRNLKTDITYLTEPNIDNLMPVSFHWKEHDDGHLHYGYIAQDVQEVMPELVRESNTGTLSLAYTEIIPLLHMKIKQQDETIQALKGRIEALESAVC